jgi:elongation factor G
MAPMPPLIIQRAIRPATPADRERLDAAMRTISVEEPNVEFDAHELFFSRVFVRGTGEREIEAVVERLRTTFHVDLLAGSRDAVLPIYRVAFTRVATGEMKHATQSGGRGQYAHVKIRLLPAAPGTGLVFQNEITGGSIPPEFIKAVEDGVRNALPLRPVGWPVDARVEVYDGSYHDVDSTEAAFALAGHGAFVDAAKKARPVLFEPMMRVTLGAGAGMPTSLVALSVILRRSSPATRAKWVIEFDHFAPRAEPGDYETDRWSNVGARLRPSPTLNQSSIALPEPD